jgi:hypothetical protein
VKLHRTTPPEHGRRWDVRDLPTGPVTFASEVRTAAELAGLERPAAELPGTRQPAA